MIQNNLIFSSLKYDVKKFLFLGSSCIYPKEASLPISEDQILRGPLEETNQSYAIKDCWHTVVSIIQKTIWI